MVDIELNRIADPEGDDASAVSWAASWGLHGDTSGIEDSSDKLAELVAAILADLQPWTSRYTLTLAWTLDGDAPRGHTVAEAVAATGVTLPTTTNPERASR